MWCFRPDRNLGQCLDKLYQAFECFSWLRQVVLEHVNKNKEKTLSLDMVNDPHGPYENIKRK